MPCRWRSRHSPCANGRTRRRRISARRCSCSAACTAVGPAGQCRAAARTLGVDARGEPRPGRSRLASSLNALALSRGIGTSGGRAELFRRAIRIRNGQRRKRQSSAALQQPGAALHRQATWRAPARPTNDRSPPTRQHRRRTGGSRCRSESWLLLRDREEFDAARPLLERALEIGGRPSARRAWGRVYAGLPRRSLPGPAAISRRRARCSTSRCGLTGLSARTTSSWRRR